MILAITWSFDPEIVNLPSLSPRWYGLLFAIAFYSGYIILRKIWLKEGLTEKQLDKFSWFVIIATLVGARLGHVFFYGPYYDQFDDFGLLIQEGYLDHPWSILNIREGGLASHGAALGILMALWLYKRVSKLDKSYLWIVDRLVIVVALGGALVRVGNFANSEIIGKPTNSENGVVFMHSASGRLEKMVDDEEQGLASFDISEAKGDTIIDSLQYQKYTLEVTYEGEKERFGSFVAYMLGGSLNTSDPTYRHTWFDGQQAYEVESAGNTHKATLTLYGLPRHPAQLYEAFCYVLIFLLLFMLYQKYGTSISEGLLFGTFLATVFTARFIIEFVKENQVDFEAGRALNQGQLLSIPFVAVGLGLIIYSLLRKKKVQASS